MKVTVVRLRCRGEKLPPEAISEPHRGVVGDLVIDTETSMRTGKRIQYAILVDGFNGLLPPLREITRFKVRNGSMLLVGTEEAETRERGRYAEFRQAWWITPCITPQGAIADVTQRR